MKKMKKIVFCVISTIMLAACTSTYKYDFNNPSDKPLEMGKRIAVTGCDDGVYKAKSEVYEGSGMTVVKAVQSNLIPFSDNVVVVESARAITDFSAEEAAKYDYIVVPFIINWEDHATAWNGIPAKDSVSIKVYGADKTLLKSVVFDGKSESMTLGSTDPADLLDEPLETFFKSAFGK